MRAHPSNFRAWHKPTQRMFPVYGFNKDFVFEETLDGIHTGETTPANRADCVVMQSTNLLDKNGKEIYEGDIVRAAFMYHGKASDQKFYAVIIYNEHIGQYQISYNSVGGAASDEIYFKYEVEIIGNLAENPELMESSK